MDEEIIGTSITIYSFSSRLIASAVRSWRLDTLSKNFNCRDKQIPRRLKFHKTPEVYAHKRAILVALENLSERGTIDLYDGDERQFSREPCIPYGWQFADEAVTMPAEKGSGRIFKIQAYSDLILLEHLSKLKSATRCFHKICSKQEFLFDPPSEELFSCDGNIYSHFASSFIEERERKEFRNAVLRQKNCVAQQFFMKCFACFWHSDMKTVNARELCL